MCTRYALGKDLPELKDIFETALRSSLTSKFIDTHARPLITDGEVRPTDIVPVIAPNAKGIKVGRDRLPTSLSALVSINKHGRAY